MSNSEASRLPVSPPPRRSKQLPIYTIGSENGKQIVHKWKIAKYIKPMFIIINTFVLFLRFNLFFVRSWGILASSDKLLSGEVFVKAKNRKKPN